MAAKSVEQMTGESQKQIRVWGLVGERFREFFQHTDHEFETMAEAASTALVEFMESRGFLKK